MAYRGRDWAAPEEARPHLSPGERVPGIVHDTVKIIGLPQGLHLLELHLQEVILLPCEDQEKGLGGGGRQGGSVWGSATFSGVGSSLHLRGTPPTWGSGEWPREVWG